MTEQIYGNNAITELLENNSSGIDRVIIEKGFKSDKISSILDLCRQKGVRFDIVPSLSSFNAAGKGVIALTTGFNYTVPEDLDWNYIRSVVILDGIEDPHNLGAIIRSAAGSGFDLVAIPERNASGVTDTVINVSAGTIFKISIARIKNISSFIEMLKKNGFWITGTDMDGRCDYSDYDYTEKSAIVIGNEGRGLRRLVKEKCDDVVRIDLENGVESLNASVAAALILFERKKKLVIR
jgi:23S rRNA (guanosine2251-2'-O)-methyltransferase